MSLSQVKITVQDGGLGEINGSGDQNVIHVDVATAAVPNQLVTFSSLNNVASSLGLGSGVDDVGYALQQSQGLVSFLGIEPSVPGAIGAVSHNGTGAGTITVSAAPTIQKTIVITSTGVNGVAQYKVLDVDGYSAAFVVPGNADGYIARIPGTYMHVTFPEGTYTDGYSATISTLGTITTVGSLPSISMVADPIDDYVVSVTITSSGSTGSAKATFSLDGYNTSPQFILSSSYAIPNSGLVLAASGSFVAGDVYSFQTCGPSFADSDLSAALNGLQLVTNEFEMIHVNNKPATLAAAASTAVIIDAACQGLLNVYAPVTASVNVPQNGSVAQSSGSLVVVSGITQTATEAAFANDASVWVVPCAYDTVIAQPISGLSLRRNFSWMLMGRLAQISGATDAAWVQLGGMAAVAVSDLENLDEGLSDSGFSTPTQYPRRSGIFVNQATTLSYKNNSDYSYVTNRRVMNDCIKVAYDVLVNFLNSKQLVNSKTGFITQSAANAIEGQVNNAFNAQLIQVADPQCSAAECIVNRMNNILISQTLEVTIVITPFGYGREIELVIGFGLQS